MIWSCAGFRKVCNHLTPCIFTVPCEPFVPCLDLSCLTSALCLFLSPLMVLCQAWILLFTCFFKLLTTLLFLFRCTCLSLYPSLSPSLAQPSIFRPFPGHSNGMHEGQHANDKRNAIGTKSGGIATRLKHAGEKA